jgi:hypothetical protein
VKKLNSPAKDTGLAIDGRFVTDAHRAELEGKEITEELLEKMRMAVTASAFCTPEVSNAAIIQDLHRTTHIDALVDELRHLTALVQDGSLQRPKAMLMAQAQALDSLFLTLCKRSLANAREGQYLEAADRYMRLALKAQSQAVRTLEVLGQLVNPRPMAFVQQANIANGPQQVNNQPLRETSNSADQTISEASNGIFTDARTPSIEGATNPPMGTLEEVQRSKDPGRQDKG